MLRLVDPSTPIKWVHPSDRDSSDPTVFHILPLTEGQSRKIRAAHPTLLKSGTVALDNKEMMFAMFVQHVTLIANVVWPGGGAPSDVTTEADKRRFLDCVPAEYMEDVYKAIQETGELDAGAMGNSDGSHASPT